MIAYDDLRCLVGMVWKAERVNLNGKLASGAEMAKLSEDLLSRRVGLRSYGTFEQGKNIKTLYITTI